MLEKLDPPFRFALPKVSADGELLGYYTKFIRDLRCGEHSTSHEARLNGQRACVTVYHSRLIRYFTNPAKDEFETLKRVRVEIFSIFLDPLDGCLTSSRGRYSQRSWLLMLTDNHRKPWRRLHRSPQTFLRASAISSQRSAIGRYQ